MSEPGRAGGWLCAGAGVEGHGGVIMLCDVDCDATEPVGSSAPRLPSTDKINSETKPAGVGLAMACQAQASPPPKTR